MKWVLRASGTEFFLRQDGTFTKNIQEAYDVPNVKAALQLCQKQSLIGMELVLRYGSTLEASIQMGDVC